MASRLHVGRYRVLYETGETTIWVRRVDRILWQQAGPVGRVPPARAGAGRPACLTGLTREVHADGTLASAVAGVLRGPAR